MSKSKIWNSFVILAHALVLWALCGMVMFIGMEVASMETTLIIHLIAAPIFAALISKIYFKKFSYTAPLQTAIIFLSVVIFMDFFVVSLLIEKSFEMFRSIIGTWGPFALIFFSVYITGLSTKRIK
jgi:hypothetical protein